MQEETLFSSFRGCFSRRRRFLRSDLRSAINNGLCRGLIRCLFSSLRNSFLMSLRSRLRSCLSRRLRNGFRSRCLSGLYRFFRDRKIRDRLSGCRFFGRGGLCDGFFNDDGGFLYNSGGDSAGAAGAGVESVAAAAAGGASTGLTGSVFSTAVSAFEAPQPMLCVCVCVWGCCFLLCFFFLVGADG
ncbi:hypothetical protein BC829DRAFT_5008 [Chytridium lagenaria]|nr:hypothetical protein BC829DRAFT_5008 [Chytridium lagenaria]